MMPNITQLLFDCDNTLVLSEDLAFEACANLANEILSKHNVQDAPQYTGPDLITDFVGQNFRGMMDSLQKKYSFTMTPDELDKYVELELECVTAILEEKAIPCVGANDALEALGGKYGMAVVSSSALSRVKAAIKKVGQDRYFDQAHVYSAASSLPKPTSKPDPAVYLFACEKLGKKPEECVAIEDSKSGATSANRAGIHVMGYVGCYETEEKRVEVREILRGCGAKVIMEEWSDFQACLQKIETTPSKL